MWFLDANEAAFRFHGVSYDEYLQLRLWDLAVPRPPRASRTQFDGLIAMSPGRSAGANQVRGCAHGQDRRLRRAKPGAEDRRPLGDPGDGAGRHRTAAGTGSPGPVRDRPGPERRRRGAHRPGNDEICGRQPHGGGLRRPEPRGIVGASARRDRTRPRRVENGWPLPTTRPLSCRRRRSRAKCRLRCRTAGSSVEVRNNAFQSEGRWIIAVSIRDISERKQQRRGSRSSRMRSISART